MERKKFMFQKNCFLLFSFCFCFANLLLGNDMKAQLDLEAASAKSLETNFIAEVEYPLNGNPLNFEPEGTYYYRLDDGKDLYTRLDVTYSSQSTTPGKKMILIDSKFGKFELGTMAKLKGELEVYKPVPPLHMEFFAVFAMRDSSDFSYGEKDVIYDGVPCYEIIMTPREVQPQGLGKAVFTIGKDNQFIYCVKKYNAEGVEEDITQFVHTQFKNVQFKKLSDEVFMPPKNMEITTFTTPEEYLKYHEFPAGTKSSFLSWRLIAKVIFSFPFIIILASISILLIAFVIFLKYFRKR